MGLCSYCGKDAGWFRSQHAECASAEVDRLDVERQEQEAQAAAARQQQEDKKALKLKLCVDFVETLLNHGSLLDLEGRVLDEIAAGRISHADQRHIFIAGWKQALERFLDDGLLDSLEEARLLDAQTRFHLSSVELDDDGAFSRLAKSSVLRRVIGGEPVDGVALESGHPINLQGGETPIWSFAGAQYWEDITRRQYQGRSQGVSLRVMSGVYYRLGGFKGEPVFSTERKHIDTGMVLLTDENIYFHGAVKSLRVPYRKIVSFTPYSDGFGVIRDAATAKPQSFVVGDGWFAYNLVVNLAKGD